MLAVWHAVAVAVFGRVALWPWPCWAVLTVCQGHVGRVGHVGHSGDVSHVGNVHQDRVGHVGYVGQGRVSMLACWPCVSRL